MVKIFADSSRTRMRFIRELDTAWNTLPASGNSRELRYTSSTINTTKDTVTSDEIHSDRMVADVIETAKHSAGEINVEFSAGSHDDFLEGFSYGFWSRPMTFDQVKGSILAFASTSTLTITGADYSSYFKSGARVRTNGFVNPANNDYFQLSADATYSGNVTTLTFSTTTSVVEAGTGYSALYAANDVLVLKNTAIRSGTSGASAFDSNSTNAFAAAITAGQLVVGQKVYIDGLGYETGTVTFATGTVSAGTVITVGDSVNSVSFQFGGTVPAGYISVDPGASNTTTATNFAAAVNAQRPLGLLNIAAKVSAGVVTFKNLNEAGGSIAKTGDSGTLVTIAAFSGGNAAANGFYTLTSVANDVLGVSPTPPTIANTTVAVSVKGSMLRNPNLPSSITPHSYVIETAFEDVAQYFYTTGQRIASFSYDIASNAVIKGSFGTQGSNMYRSISTKLGTSPYTAQSPTTTNIANATVNVGALTLNNAALSTAIQSISIKGTNNLREQMAISNKYPAGIGAGRIELTGNVVAYFADGTLWDKFVSHATVSLGYSITDADQNVYYWTIPAVVFDTDTVNPAGRDQDIMENLSWTAKKDIATQCVFQIDRFSNVSPTAAF